MTNFKDEFTLMAFGRAFSIAQSGKQCVCCGEFNLEFRDELSRKEYKISGMCQCCQDSVFNTNNNE